MINVDGLQNLDAGVMDKLENLERQILFRSYYFQGGTPKKFVHGIGKDTDKIHYDNSTDKRDYLREWNPRYLDDYINQARQYGYHTLGYMRSIWIISSK